MSPRRAAQRVRQGDGQQGRRPRSARHRQRNLAGTEPAGKADFTPSHRCRRRTSHPCASKPLAARAWRARHRSKQTPGSLHPALLCERGFQPWATGWRHVSPDPAELCLVMQTTTGAVSRSWTAAWQSGAFSSSSSRNGCQSPVGSCPGSCGCLRPHAEHHVPAMNKGLSLPGVPQQVGAGTGAHCPSARCAVIPQCSCEPAPSAGFTVLEVSSSAPVLPTHSVHHGQSEERLSVRISHPHNAHRAQTGAGSWGRASPRVQQRWGRDRLPHCW